MQDIKKWLGIEKRSYGKFIDQCRDDCVDSIYAYGTDYQGQLDECFRKCECQALAMIFKEAAHSKKDIRLPCE
jgi:hypothetical protein